MRLISKAKENILTNKKIRKKGIIIDNSLLNYLGDVYFASGELNPTQIEQTLGIKDKEVVKYIARKFNHITYLLTQELQFDEDKQVKPRDRKKVKGLSIANYKFFDREKYLRKLAELIVKLNDEMANKILENREYLSDLAKLLPLVGITEEFSITEFINILANFNRIKSRILNTNVLRIPPHNLILRKLGNAIFLGAAYNSNDDIFKSSLGLPIVNILGEEYSKLYSDFYLQMLQRNSSFIPPVHLNLENHTFISGEYSNPNRLLIGRIPYSHSCIDLTHPNGDANKDPAGIDTYRELLLQNTGDVIIVKSNKGEMVSRILLIRRGNVIQIFGSFNVRFSLETYQKIAYQIIEQAKLMKDNIEYIFINDITVSKVNIENSRLPNIIDERFGTKFSHADKTNSATLVGSKTQNNTLHLDFDATPHALYEKVRMNIFYYPTESDITRLRALDALLQEDPILKEEKSRDFEPFCMNDYKTVVCGEDFYIAIKNDGTIEEVSKK